jgi:cell division protein FtsI (penicillin-binding protein 3)
VFAWPDPDTAATPRGGRVPNVVGLTLKEGVGRLHRAGLRARVEGYGEIVRTSPAPGDSVRAGRLVTVWAQPPRT